jgi:hypothetical protein
VTGTPPAGTDVSASNPSHYFGSEGTGPTDLPTTDQPGKGSLYLPSVETP